MNQANLENMTSTIFSKCIKLLLSKGHDYACTEDELSNFKRIGQLIELEELDAIEPCESFCVLMIYLKMDRLCNLLKSNKKPKNETLEDTVVDLINYVILLRGLIYDRTEST